MCLAVLGLPQLAVLSLIFWLQLHLDLFGLHSAFLFPLELVDLLLEDLVELLFGMCYFLTVFLFDELFQFGVGLGFLDLVLVLPTLQQVQKVVDMFPSFEQQGGRFSQNGLTLR